MLNIVPSELSKHQQYSPSSPITATKVPAHNVFAFEQVIFSSNFDNGNLARVEKIPNRSYEYKIWTAPDNMGTDYQSKHCAWFHFVVSGLPVGCVLRIQITNALSSSGLYKHDMRPVYRSNSTGNRWTRLKGSMRFLKEKENSEFAQIFFEHSVEANDEKIFFAFTYPYSYTLLQNELAELDTNYSTPVSSSATPRATSTSSSSSSTTTSSTSSAPAPAPKPHDIYYKRELVTESCDRRRIDLLTITSHEGANYKELEPLLSGLFPDSNPQSRPPEFPKKEVVFISARVHSGEVPAQHTFKGILNLLMDKDDLRARELRARYVFKLIPMLNPDGVFRGHFRMDQHGQNLNRYYTNPDSILQPAIFAAKSLTDYYASTGKLAVYLDFHAHASKRGCFIYGNVLDTFEEQVQNQLYCKLIAMNTPHFDYEGCLFSKEHMFRIDPGDQAKGLTAEGSGRVSTYLSYKLVHSYTIECNYNTSKVGNEISPTDGEPGGHCNLPATPFTANPEKYTPATYAGVGAACIIALLDIRGHNPCSRIPKSKFKTLDRVRNAVIMEVKGRKDFQLKHLNLPTKKGGPVKEEYAWRRVVDSIDISSFGVTPVAAAPGAAVPSKVAATSAVEPAAPTAAAAAVVAESQAPTNSKQAVAFCISMKDGHKWERRRRPSSTVTTVSDRIETSPSQIRHPSSNGAIAVENRSLSTGGRLQDSSPSTQSSQSSKSFVVVGSSQGSKSNLLTFNDGELTTAAVAVSAVGRGAEVLTGRTRSAASPTTTERLGRLLGASAKDKIREQSLSLTPSSASGFSIDTRGIKGPIALPPSLHLQQHPTLMPAPISARREGLSREIPLPPTASQSASKRLGGSVSNGGSSSNNSNNKVFKDSRKILGKTLHAAGVALIMSTNSSDNIVVAGLQDSGGGELTTSSPSVKHQNHSVDANPTGPAVGDGDYSIAYEGSYKQKALIPFPIKPPMVLPSSIAADDGAPTVESITAALTSSSLVNIEGESYPPVSDMSNMSATSAYRLSPLR